MNYTVALEEKADQVSLSIRGFDLISKELASERLSEIEQLLSAVLSFDAAVSALSDEDLRARNSACAAMDLKYQVYVGALNEHLKTAKRIAEGSADIADYGFPEFSNA